MSIPLQTRRGDPQPVACRGPIPAPAPDVLSPFQSRLFLAFWTASMMSNFGVLVQGVGAASLMTSLATSALIVTLVTVATALPLVFLSLAAGAVADVWDKRRVMLVAQALMLLVSGALAVVAYLDLVTPLILLGLTFLLGCGAALYAPASQAAVGELVPREELAGAVSLNSLGVNVARAVASMACKRA